MIVAALWLISACTVFLRRVSLFAGSDASKRSSFEIDGGLIVGSDVFVAAGVREGLIRMSTVNLTFEFGSPLLTVLDG